MKFYRVDSLTMIRGLFVVFTLLGLSSASLIAADTSPAKPTRLAIVSADVPTAKTLADLLTVELSSWTEFQLLERAEVDRILSEHKLQASGLLAADRSLELGRLAAVELLVLVESLPKSEPPQHRLRVMEIRTGVRLLDLLVEAKALDQAATQLADGLRRVREKLRTPEEQRHYVALIGVRSDEPGNMLGPQAVALTELLDHDLHQSPQVFVLEREQLHRLRGEQNLTGAELKLRSAVNLIEAGFRRTEDGLGFAVQLKLLSLQGAAPRTAQFTVKQSQVKDVRPVLAEQCRKLLGTVAVNSSAATASDLQSEAAQFVLRTKWLMGVRPAEAADFAETALALEPSEGQYRLAIQAQRAVWQKSFQQGNNEARLTMPQQREQKLSDNLLSLLKLARRIHELELVYYGLPPEVNNSGGRERRALEPLELLGANGWSNPFSPHMPRWWDGPESTEIAKLRKEVDDLRWEKFRRLMEANQARKRDTVQLQNYRLELAYYFSETPEHLQRQIRDWQKELDQELERAQSQLPAIPHEKLRQIEARRLIEMRTANAGALFLQRRLFTAQGYSDGADDEPRSWPIEKIVPIWAELTAHPSLIIRAVAWAGLADQADSAGRAALDSLLKCLAELPSDPNRRYHPIDLESQMDYLAVRQLARHGKVTEVIEKRLAEVEEKKDVSSLWQQRPRFHTIYFFAAPDRTKLPKRVLDLVDKYPPQDAEGMKQAATFRDGIISAGKPGNVSLPEEMRFKPPTTGPWAEYSRRPIALNMPTEFRGWSSGYALVEWDARSRHDPTLFVICGLRGGSIGSYPYWIGRSSITGEDLQEVGQTTHYGSTSTVRRRYDIATGNAFIAFNTLQPGFTLFNADKPKSFGPTEGFPGNALREMEWLDGKLYLSLGNGLAAFDPEKGSFQLLASSTAVDGKGPLDGGGQYVIDDLLADSERKELWLTVTADARRTDQGLWRYTPASGKLQRMLELSANPTFSNLWWYNGKLRFIVSSKWCELDPETGITKELTQFSTLRKPMTTAKLSQLYVQLGPNIVTKEGLLYAPDGTEHKHPLRFPWSNIASIPNGMMVLDANEGVILYEPRTTKQSQP